MRRSIYILVIYSILHGSMPASAQTVSRPDQFTPTVWGSAGTPLLSLNNIQNSQLMPAAPADALSRQLILWCARPWSVRGLYVAGLDMAGRQHRNLWMLNLSHLAVPQYSETCLRIGCQRPLHRLLYGALSVGGQTVGSTIGRQNGWAADAGLYMQPRSSLWMGGKISYTQHGGGWQTCRLSICLHIRPEPYLELSLQTAQAPAGHWEWMAGAAVHLSPELAITMGSAPASGVLHLGCLMGRHSLRWHLALAWHGVLGSTQSMGAVFTEFIPGNTAL